MLRYRLRDLTRTFFPRPEGMSPTLHALLIQRGIASAEEAERYLHPAADQLRDPFLLSSMGEAVARIRAALASGEPICVYGDYDVDGVSASALLADFLRGQGGQVEVYLPSRHSEGYGLNEAAVRAIAARAKLLVTVDCGVTSVELIALAKSLGLDCIVTDHHEPSDVLPDCPVVNPLLADYPFGFLCGAGVAFKLVQALGGEEAALRYVDIAALATVADVVPLTDENRAIVKLGLDRINAAPRTGIHALIEVSGLSDKHISAGNVAFQLAPRLNAGGRLGDARRAHDLLLTDSAETARVLAEELEMENARRKQVEADILAEAEAQLASFDFPAHRAIVLAGEGWNPGVIGLTASRLVEKYHYPTILLSRVGDTLTGSCRSIPGVDIHAALTAVSSRLIRFGGHKQAAGLTMAACELDAFCAEMDAFLRESVSAQCYVPDAEYDMSIAFSELTQAFAAELDALQPTGFGNPAPVLRTEADVLEKRAVGLDGAHLRLILSEGSVHRTGIFFRAGAMAETLPDRVDALFAPKLNTFMGRTDVQLELKAVKTGDVMAEIAAKVGDEDDLQHEFLTQILYNKEINSARRDAQSISLSELRELMSDEVQGTLILTADLGCAARIAHALDPMFPDVFFGTVPDDPRAFNALCTYPPCANARGYRRIVLAAMPEGFGVPEAAKVLRLDERPAWFDELPDVDMLREVYKSLRRLASRPASHDTFGALTHLISCDTRLSGVCCAAAALALNDMHLIELSLDEAPVRFKMHDMRKTDPESSAVWRTIRAWRES